MCISGCQRRRLLSLFVFFCFVFASTESILHQLMNMLNKWGPEILHEFFDNYLYHSRNSRKIYDFWNIERISGSRLEKYICTYTCISIIYQHITHRISYLYKHIDVLWALSSAPAIFEELVDRWTAWCSFIDIQVHFEYRMTIFLYSNGR